MVDGKFQRENAKENFFGVCLVRWGGRKINGEVRMFFPQAYQKSFLPKMERKLKEENEATQWTKMPMCTCT